MQKLGEVVGDTAQQLSISYRQHTLDESRRIHREVVQKFTTLQHEPFWLWEHLNDAVAVRNGEGWRWISEFETQEAILFFFNSHDEEIIFEFQRMSDIVTVLEETQHFEFYLCDRSCTYLLCFNHHDYLIASGVAKDWLGARLG
ncbi:MAG: DUF6756 family protein [bacterium]|nr:DUF6756 family protein [bacterium]